MDIKDFLLDQFDDFPEVERTLYLGGKPKQMKFKPLSATKGDEIRDKCKKITFHKGQKMVETDGDKYIANMIIEVTTVPDLKSKELQDAWGVIGAEDLLHAMKTRMFDGEFAKWADAVSGVSAYTDKGLNELVEEVKN